MDEINQCYLSVVIPVYGSEKILNDLCAELVVQLKSIKKLNKKFEIIFISDQSPDNSWSIIKNLAKRYREVRGISLRVNVGQHNAIMAGLRKANGELIITMDDDLQHSPKDLNILLRHIALGYDVVYARFKDRKHPFWKLLGSKFNNFASYYLISKPKDLYLSPFKIFRASIKNEVIKYTGPNPYLDGLILSVTRNISSVNVEHQLRHSGVSYYGFRKSISLWLKMAINFSIFPLRLTSFFGLFFSIVGMVSATYLVFLKLNNPSIPIGWSSMIVVSLSIGGIQLLAIGVIGEYLGRVLLSLNKLPQYSVDEEV
jgi:glycosyltransferase involved in cell wall biosynthesis